jgi:hypothetical protein
MPAILRFTLLVLLEMLGAARTGALATMAPEGDAVAPDPPAPGVANMTSYQESIVLGCSADAADREEIHGQPCADGYTRSFTAAMMSGSGFCMVEGWASDDPRDCRVRVRVRGAPPQSGVCTVTVYESPM